MEHEISNIQKRYKIVGRKEELTNAFAAVSAGKHVLFEGPVGVGKTVVANALASYFSRNFVRIDGDERYTEHKLTGWFDPATVVAKGYTRETFLSGPLTQAMKDGSFLFINELNRMPESTQNVLLPVMDEGQLIIPKIGTIRAASGFLIIATQNPEEFVGTSRLSEAIRDRFVQIRLDYQSEIEEFEIVKKETMCKDNNVVEIAVRIARKTRADPDIRHGASIRGAIDITELVQRLSENPASDSDVWLKAATMALATKIELENRTDKRMQDVITKIVLSVLEECRKDGGQQPDIELTQSSENKTKEVSRSYPVKEIETALEEKNLAKAIDLLKQNFRLLSDILLDEDLSKTIFQSAERFETNWLALELLFITQASVDPKRRRVAREILNRAIRRIAARIVGKGMRPTMRVNVPFRPGLEEFDLEETLENRLGKSFFDYEDVVGIERRPKKRSFSLILDTSNSMQTEKIINAALTVGVFANMFMDDHYSVITFKDHAQLLKQVRDKPNMEMLIEKMLDIQTGGLTNIEEALQEGLEQLNELREAEGVGILVTDGWVTSGGNPVGVAAKYPKLHVIQVPLGLGGGDSEMCMNLAMAGRGRYSYIHDHYWLPQAIMKITK